MADGTDAVPLLPPPPLPELTECTFLRYYGPWAPLHPSEVLRMFDGTHFTWWVVGGWSLEADPRRPRRRHEDIDVAVRADQAEELRERLRDYHLWQTYPGLRPVFPGEPLAEGVDQMWVRRDAWSPWLMDVQLSPVDATEWVYKRDPQVRLPLDQVVRVGPDGVPYQVPKVGLLFKARLARGKDLGDLEACWPRLEESDREWLRETLALTEPDHAWLAWMAQHSS